MGQYNPHAPYILGQEWVPIRNAHYVPDGVVERGYTFTLDATTVPVSGAFYVEEIAPNVVKSACDFISIYPAGHETLSGPIKRVQIPASAIVVTNLGSGSIDISAGVEALFSPEDSKSIGFTADTGSFEQLQVSFNTEAYAALLLGKRIVDLRLRYSLQSFNVANSANMTFNVHNQNAFKSVRFPQITEITSTSSIGKISVLSLTELNPTWNSAADFSTQRTVLPWRFQELNRFRAAEPAASALTIFMQNNAEIFPVFLGFMDLEVLYCEETRVLYGGFKTYDDTSSLIREVYNVGAIAAQLYSPTTFTPGATLTAGDYVVTIYHRDISSRSIFQGASRIHALREYYQLLPQRGIHVHQTTILDDQFVRSSSDVLTQITLHTATQIVTGSHPYGTQYGAPVYGVRFANQEIEDDPGPSVSTPYPQVRFYARRYGDTTVPLTLTDVATGTNTVSITVEEFDALDEIVDGWRQVTLRFDSPPSFVRAAGAPDWRWTAAGELAGNQWQVMVADGPTGAWNPNPTAAATGPATYWAPAGSTVTLTWQSPSVSGVANDTTSDAVLIFSQDPPAVTGFAISAASISVSGAVDACGVDPRCIPTAVYGLELTWDPFGTCDDFDDRTETDTWGDAPNGETWLNSGGVAANYDVVDGVATTTLTTVNASRNSTLSALGFADQHVEATIGINAAATGAALAGAILLRHADNSNRYLIEIRVETTNAVTLRLRKQVAGTLTTLYDYTLVSTVHFAGARYRLVTDVIGPRIRARAWQIGKVEPATWQINVIDGDLTAAGSYGLRGFAYTGNTNVDPVITFDDFVAYSAQVHESWLEIQRQDDVDETWQTIMQSLSAGTCPVSFRDFEARVGIEARYRARVVNVLDFAGPWVTGSGTIPAPGVAVAGDGVSTLIFTSNADVDAGLAYVTQFENQPVETFSFPEADLVSLQRLFGRDFFLAIRPLERGGERFTRTLLVNNAAISLPSLANFRDLRDLAWADLDYICVRDELGNRWLATVIVPDGQVRADRTVYLARIDVAEVTNTPTPVDPT